MLEINFKNMCFKLIFLLNFKGSFASTAQEAFLQANKFCVAGEFAKALDIYNTIGTKGSAVWYNMGNCYFYQKDFPSAIWAWLHACKTGKGIVVVNSEQNIAVAQNLLEIKARSGYYPKIDFLSIQLWWLLLIYGLFIILIKKYGFRKKIWVLFFLLEIGLLGMVFWYEKAQRVVYGVIQRPTNIVAGPAGQYHILGSILSGQIVRISHDLDEWCYVEDGKIQGWLIKKDLLIV